MTLGLFEGFGVEVEYALVDRKTWAAWPGADKLLAKAAGTPEPPTELERGALRWSNERALHVLEMKTNGPAERLEDIPAAFQGQLKEANVLLRDLGATLLPGGMHPTMDPEQEARLWPHGSERTYQALHEVFDCRGHGWSNVQSVHLNLPFASDEEFGRLHAAIRLLLPIMPALAASSPICEGRYTGWLDTRMEVYRHNARRVPEVTGSLIPEPVFTRDQYESEILQPMYRAMRSLEPAGLLQHEWLNARAAVPRFGRSSIEIRVLDAQESPPADLAVIGAIVTVLDALCAEKLCSHETQRGWGTERLARIFGSVIRDAEATLIHDADYLQALGVQRSPVTAGEVWRSLMYRLPPYFDFDSSVEAALETILERGSLATRIRRFAGAELAAVSLQALSRELSSCLFTGRCLDPQAPWTVRGSQY